jgi:cathepsin L
LKSDRQRPPACKHSDPSFDWRSKKKVTQVMDQRACGSCWAFAAIAAYESSYLIENGIESSASQQQALDCASPHYSCSGGWYDKVFDMLTGLGDTDSSSYPYVARKSICQRHHPVKYLADTWGFVKAASVPSDKELKTALCEHGPLVVAVNSKGWETYFKSNADGTENPQWKHFPKGVFPGEPSKPGLSMKKLKPGDVDHAVLVVGWDDGAWIIKNSWGSGFGDGGYIKLAFGRSNLGFNAAWIRAISEKAPLSQEASIQVRMINDGRFERDRLVLGSRASAVAAMQKLDHTNFLANPQDGAPRSSSNRATAAASRESTKAAAKPEHTGSRAPR